VAQYVAPAGQGWVDRFERLCAAAVAVTIGCEERLLGDETLIRFNNQMLQGLARLRGEALGRPAHLMVTFSPFAEATTGSPADFMDHWPEMSRLSVIDLDDLRADAGLGDPDPAEDLDLDLDALDLALGVSPRAIRAILFADIATFTQFEDREIPLLFDYLAEAQARVEARAKTPILINTWGDAVHAAAETAHDLADYAVALTEAVAGIDPAAFDLAKRPQFRIALHAGPVFVGLHPLTGRSMIFGHHVNRAARIEPLATPGGIAASQHFVALLTAEMAERADAARLTGEAYAPRYSMAYLGRMALPKDFGSEDLYRLHDRQDPVAEAAAPDREARTGMAPPDTLRLDLAPALDQIAVLAARIDAFCHLHGFGDAVAHAVNLSLDELLTNTISYGFEGIEPAPIAVMVRRVADSLEVTVSDAGAPFDPGDAPAPDLDAGVEDRPIGGLGLFLVHEMMDRVDYRRADGRNVVTLVKRTPAEGGATGTSGTWNDPTVNGS
jgi:anti-sigma regulatory factor (Ser/Thr protein kinase)/class 3 adenylate cyclase